MDIEGVTLDELKAMLPEDIDALLSFGNPITFRFGSATFLVEFNRCGEVLQVNLAHIDDGGEGVLLRLWKLILAYARERCFETVEWRVHALTCVEPNPRLIAFLEKSGFVPTEDERHGRVLRKMTVL